MAIKKVDFIPSAYVKAVSTRQKVRADLEEAINNRIPMFEFEGDYNYKTLGSYARDEADRLFREWVFYPAVESVKSTLGKELGRDDIECERLYREYKQVFKIHGVTQKDRVHVYVEIDFDFLDKYTDTLMRRTRVQYGLRGNRKGIG